MQNVSNLHVHNTDKNIFIDWLKTIVQLDQCCDFFKLKGSQHLIIINDFFTGFYACLNIQTVQDVTKQL